jgi:hypothetical protein
MVQIDYFSKIILSLSPSPLSSPGRWEKDNMRQEKGGGRLAEEELRGDHLDSSLSSDAGDDGDWRCTPATQSMASPCSAQGRIQCGCCGISSPPTPVGSHERRYERWEKRERKKSRGRRRRKKNPL